MRPNHADFRFVFVLALAALSGACATLAQYPRPCGPRCQLAEPYADGLQRSASTAWSTQTAPACAWRRGRSLLRYPEASPQLRLCSIWAPEGSEADSDTFNAANSAQ
jgi:hypothetical protein